MKNWEFFIEESSLTKEFLDAYLKFRLGLKKYGYTEKMLRKVTSAPIDVIMLREEARTALHVLFNQLKLYGFDIHFDEFNEYLKPKLINIDSLTPLKNGDNKRDNSGDEDY